MHNPSEIEKDAALMLEVANGNATASRLVAELYLDGPFRLALRILGDSSLAEDMASQSTDKNLAASRHLQFMR